jgi:hypothetical protein
MILDRRAMMNKSRVRGFLRFSEAVALLAQGMWGGLKQPAPVIKAKKLSKKHVSIAFEPWKKEAGERLAMSAVSEEIPIYAFGRPQAEAGDRSPKLIRVPGAVLRRLVKVRGSLPDHPRASMKAVEGNGELYRALNTGLLVLRKSDFGAWYRRERRKGRWHSQRSKLKKEGRPTRQTDALRNSVAAIMPDEVITIAELRRRLVASGLSNVPSEDTLARLVDQLYRETGNPKFLRRQRDRRK